MIRYLDPLGEVNSVSPTIDSGAGMPGDLRASAVDSSRFQGTFGWRPEIALEDGIRETVSWLAAQGASVLVTDKEPAEKLADSIKKLEGLPIEFRLGEHRESDFTSCDLIVTSPAIPPQNEFLQAAKRAGVPISTFGKLSLCPWCMTFQSPGTAWPAPSLDIGRWIRFTTSRRLCRWIF